LIFGPDVDLRLTICILLGTFIGTYSSLHLAPILVWLGVKPDSFLKVEERPALLADEGRV
jgi:preprotein translocase subunit SecF